MIILHCFTKAQNQLRRQMVKMTRCLPFLANASLLFIHHGVRFIIGNAFLCYEFVSTTVSVHAMILLL